MLGKTMTPQALVLGLDSDTIEPINAVKTCRKNVFTIIQTPLNLHRDCRCQRQEKED